MRIFKARDWPQIDVADWFLLVVMTRMVGSFDFRLVELKLDVICWRTKGSDSFIDSIF